MSNSGAHQGAEEEEPECRVCRGPAEEGSPLYRPCKCSGSIGWCHQDCLESWLRVQHNRGGGGGGGGAAAVGNGAAAGEAGGAGAAPPPMGGGPALNGTLGGSGGRCELCKTRFQFKPRYAEGTPDTLPLSHVVRGVVRTLVKHFSPMAVRMVVCASLWLFVAPVATSWLYLGWMRRPRFFLGRVAHWNLLTMDWVAGAVVAAVIIISFLSMMSFADFVRAQVVIRNDDEDGVNNNNEVAAPNDNPRGGVPAGGGANDAPRNPGILRNNNNNNRNRDGLVAFGPGGRRHRYAQEPIVNPTDDDIDNTVWVQLQARVVADSRRKTAIYSESRYASSLEREVHGRQGRTTARGRDAERKKEADGDDDDDDDSWGPGDDDDDDDDDDVSWDPSDGDEDNSGNNLFADEVLSSGSDSDYDPDDDPLLDRPPFARARPNNNDNAPNPNANPPRQGIQRNDARLDANVNDDDDVMDINIALDELLGVRGPVGVVVRNMLWLLTFNAVFLGFFAFVPRIVGITVSSVLFNTSNVFAHPNSPSADAVNNSTLPTQDTQLVNLTGQASLSYPMDILRAVEAESDRLSTPFKLSDLYTVVLGYLSLASALLFFKALVYMATRVKLLWLIRRRTAAVPDHVEVDRGGVGGADAQPRDALDEINRIINNANPDGDEQGIALLLAARVALDVSTAIVKVGVLLALKMFCLPIALGLFLDASSLSLFGSTLESRVAYAGRDLFSFLLLHWVAGITFMLLVTVSVLQLREVAHPKLLGQVIRPQEPQPDLLGNLLNESVATHAKRMALSIVIYAALLALHVHIPIKIIAASNLLKHAPFLRVKFSYVLTSQLQVPLELLFFHLCMLGILEKNKNTIGELQHHWFKLLGRLLGLTGALLPRSVAEFRLIGSRPVFDGSRIDPFWVSLAKADDRSREQLIVSRLVSFELSGEEELRNPGTTKSNGERVLMYGSPFVRIPTHSGLLLRSQSLLLPTKIGRFRLYRTYGADPIDPVFQLWEEVAGDVIPRPPEGWDDLGAGGADVQERWAFSKEKKSTLERGVAHREFLYSESDSLFRKWAVTAKLFIVFLLSWVATTLFLAGLFLGPLVTGRAIFYVLRVPAKWIHDPFTFALGCCFFYPALLAFLKKVVCSSESLVGKLKAWSSRFRMPSRQKALILLATFSLMCVLSPLMAGTVIDIAFIKSNNWFQGKEVWLDCQSICLNWILGCGSIYLWMRGCSSDRWSRWYIAVLMEFLAAERRPEDHRPDANNRAMHRNAFLNIPANGQGNLPPFFDRAWYGSVGRAATFLDSLRAIVQGFEWDKVDSQVLLRDVALPITFHLAIQLGMPVLVLCMSFWELPIYSVARRRLVTRSCLFLYSTFLTQSQEVWRARLGRWFATAHRLARDDRYLIGEVLLNYNEQ